MRARWISIWVTVLAGLLAAQTAPHKPAPVTDAAVPLFRDIAPLSGLTASHISSADKHYVIESMSGGMGLFDCDNDGKLDIVMVNGSTVDRFRQSGGDPLLTLCHHDADLKFPHITQNTRLPPKGPALALTS